MSLLVMRRGAGTLPAAISLTADDATVSVEQGLTVDIVLTLARTFFTGSVTLAVAGLPSGVTGAFSDSTLTGSETSSTLTLTASGVAGTVTDDAFTITASGSGVSDSVINGTVTVTASSGAGNPVAGALVEDDFNANYANTAALRAEMRQLSPAPSDPATGQFYDDCINPAFAEIAPDPISGTENWFKIPISNTNPEPSTNKNDLPARNNAAFFFEHAYEAGFTTDGSVGTDAYKIGWIFYNNANGRTGIEWTSIDSMVFSGGWVDNGGGNASTSNDLSNVTLPYGRTGVGGIWTTPQRVRVLVTSEHVGSTYQLARLWTWVDGQTVPTVPTYTHYHQKKTGNLPVISALKVGGNYNQALGNRTAAPTAIYWRRWKYYDLDVTPNPCSLDTPPTVSFSSSSLSVARGGSTTVDVTITPGSYVGNVGVSFGALNTSSLSVSASPTLSNSQLTTTVTISATGGATAGTREDVSLVFSGINVRYFFTLTVT